MTTDEREKRLVEIAEKDISYQTWLKTMTASEAEFERYADNQPQEIRNMLWAYAGSAKMIHQRLMNLVCENMRFPGESDM